MMATSRTSCLQMFLALMHGEGAVVVKAMVMLIQDY